MKKDEIKAQTKSLRKAARKDIEQSLIAGLKEISAKFITGSKKLDKKLSKQASKLSKVLVKEIKFFTAEAADTVTEPVKEAVAPQPATAKKAATSTAKPEAKPAIAKKATVKKPVTV